MHIYSKWNICLGLFNLGLERVHFVFFPKMVLYDFRAMGSHRLHPVGTNQSIVINKSVHRENWRGKKEKINLLWMTVVSCPCYTATLPSVKQGF